MTLLLLLACGPHPACEEGCVELDDGWYLADLPAGEGPFPTLIWFHAYNTDATQLRGKEAEHQDFLDAGWLILQPMGSGENWNVTGLREGIQRGRDELGFAIEVLDDADARFGIDRGRLVASGHSVGASVAHELACQEQVLAAAAPMHGSFWEPLPPLCEGDAIPLRHTHGTADTIWPMDGQSFLGAAQGGVAEGVEVWRDHNACTEPREVVDDGRSSCTVWDCAGAEVRYCEHDGKHKLESGFAGRMLAWVDEVL